MGKDFVEYQSENGRMPYSASTICFCLTQYAKDYVALSGTKEDIRDGVIVDAINYLGVQGWCDFALYTRDLYDGKKHEEEVEPQALLTVLKNHFASYINSGISKSVLRNNHMNNCEENFEDELGARTVVDFMNYIAKKNDFDRVFTIEELNQQFEKNQYKQQLGQLKRFLEKTNKYNEMLLNGQMISGIISNIAREKNWSLASKDGIYYNDGQEVHSWTQQEIDEEMFALAYSYQKLANENQIDKTKQVWNDAFQYKLTEMRKR